MPGFLGAVVLAAVFILLLILIQFYLLAKHYRKVGPNEALIISGRGSFVQRPDGTRERVGYRILTGGGTFVWPIIERLDVLSLELLTAEVKVSDTVTDSGGLVDIEGVAQVKVGGGDEAIRAAAERFLSKSREEMAGAFSQVIDGHARALARRTTAEQIERERDTFAQRVREAAAPDMTDMGLVIDSFTLRDVRIRRKGE
jgi:flotillin